MIITFSNTTLDRHTGEITYWFKVKIPEYQWTDFCVGFNERGDTFTSSSFDRLNQELQESIINEARNMLNKML